MVKTTKCLNEWNAVVEALGEGIQTLLIRKYQTSVGSFILYPTKSYAMKDDFLHAFKEEYHDFVEERKFPDMREGIPAVKYFAEVVEVLERPSNRLGRFNDYHIWSPGHVRSYLDSKAYVWILRVSVLDEPVFTDRTRGLIYANTLEPVDVSDAKPVISDDKFSSILDELQE